MALYKFRIIIIIIIITGLHCCSVQCRKGVSKLFVLNYTSFEIRSINVQISVFGPNLLVARITYTLNMAAA